MGLPEEMLVDTCAGVMGSYTAGMFWTDICVCLSGSAGQCSRGSGCHCLCNTVCRSSGKELMMVWMDFSNLSRSSSFTGSWCFLALICVGHINEERSFMQMSLCKTQRMHFKPNYIKAAVVLSFTHQFLPQLQDEVNNLHLWFVFGPCQQVLN